MSNRNSTRFPLIHSLLALSVYTGLSACGPAPVTGPQPAASPATTLSAEPSASASAGSPVTPGTASPPTSPPALPTSPPAAPTSPPAASSTPAPVVSPSPSAAAPTLPLGLQVVEQGTDHLTLKWDFSSEPVSYRLLLDGQPVAENHTSPNYYRFTGLSAGSPHRLGVQAISTAGEAGPIASLEARSLSKGSSSSGNFSSSGNSGGGTRHSSGDPVDELYMRDEQFELREGEPTDNPNLAMNAAGQAVLVWTETLSASGSEVFAQRFNRSGEALGEMFQVNTYTSGNQTNPDVALNANGDFVVVWNGANDQDGHAIGAFGQRFSASGDKLGDEFRIDPETLANQRDPAVAAGADGTFMITWSGDNGDYVEHDNDDTGVFGQLYDSDGQVLRAKFGVNSYTTAIQSEPEIAANASGNFVVVWASQNQDGSLKGIFGQRFDSTGLKAGAEIPINEITTDLQTDAQVSASDDGSFLVVWADSSLSATESTNVAGRFFAADGTPLGGDLKINSTTTGLQSFPSVAGDGQGRYLVAWVDRQDDGISDVYGQVFESNEALGEAFVIPETTRGSQDSGVVAMDADGDFLAVWNDTTLNDYEYSMRGIHYEARD